MEAAKSSETSVSSHITTQRHNPEDSGFNHKRLENLKSHMFNVFNFCSSGFMCAVNEHQLPM
jgi:hypothetical protein